MSCRFGFDVPVILRSSDETESILPTPEKQMVQVTNPFALEIGSGPASVAGESSQDYCLITSMLCVPGHVMTAVYTHVQMACR